MEHILNFDDFVNEAMVTVKRKYTDSHPAESVSNYAPVRERILSFVKENGTVTRKQLLEFIRSVNENSHRTASTNWLKRNEQYFNVKESKGETTYSLSKFGERVHSTLMTTEKKSK